MLVFGKYLLSAWRHLYGSFAFRWHRIGWTWNWERVNALVIWKVLCFPSEAPAPPWAHIPEAVWEGVLTGQRKPCPWDLSRWISEEVLFIWRWELYSGNTLSPTQYRNTQTLSAGSAWQGLLGLPHEGETTLSGQQRVLEMKVPPHSIYKFV